MVVVVVVVMGMVNNSSSQSPRIPRINKAPQDTGDKANRQENLAVSNIQYVQKQPASDFNPCGKYQTVNVLSDYHPVLWPQTVTHTHFWHPHNHQIKSEYNAHIIAANNMPQQPQGVRNQSSVSANFGLASKAALDVTDFIFFCVR